MDKTKVYIYGASDDLIEIDGAIRDEYGCYDRDVKLKCSDGTEGVISYDGDWHIKLSNRGDLFNRIEETVGDDGEKDGELSSFTSYSDILVLDEGVEWVKLDKTKYRKND